MIAQIGADFTKSEQASSVGKIAGTLSGMGCDAYIQAKRLTMSRRASA
jgi:hypothetical protein